jgi:transposase
MPQNKLSINKAVRILELFAFERLNKTQISKLLNLSRGTVIKYVQLYEKSELTYTDLFLFKKKEVISSIDDVKRKVKTTSRHLRVTAFFPMLHESIIKGDTNFKQFWAGYFKNENNGYQYTQFVDKYHKWRIANGIKKITFNRWKINEIEPHALEILNKWRLSTDRNRWEKSIAILGLYEGEHITVISKKIERSIRTIKKWVDSLSENGIEGIDLRRTRVVPVKVKEQMEEKSKNIMKLLHEPPSLHNINRTSWSLKSLTMAYKEYYGVPISMTTISRYIREKGYTFKRAKVVLTSPDPDYRSKLLNIQKILSNLKENEKFFSIDEYGPTAIKIRGGRTYTHSGVSSTVPQYQMSKGSLICTTALELSTNQIINFFSDKKNTTEMIKLLMILLEQYKSEERIFLSWDAASWHASKELDKKVAEINDDKYRKKNNTPYVELAPLPSSAQFLNVIESVFSGMAKAIIHNSNYQSVEECKNAIDRYFLERNLAFIENPKRAGKKIWGKEVVKPVFNDSNACKNPNYR